jgi:putative hydrolase of the HAD superfamily
LTIRAVLFDVGGPLDTEVQFEAGIDADIREGLATEGIEFDDDTYAEAERRAVESFAPSLYRAVIWQLTGSDIGKSQRIYDCLEAHAAERDRFELRESMAGVLDSLKQRGLKLGLAANQPAKTLDRLARHGIGHYFENRGVSGVYGFRKPDVRLFLRACGDLDVEPADCIMVGDRIDNDIAPAKLLGMRTVLFRTGRHRNQQPRSWDEIPDLEVTDVPELQRAIFKLLDAGT